jgi:hypothetical protein
VPARSTTPISDREVIDVVRRAGVARTLDAALTRRIVTPPRSSSTPSSSASITTLGYSRRISCARSSGSGW